MKTGWKIAISIVWDLLDFTIGRIPVFGTLFDVAGTILAITLYGKKGILAAVEILDIGDQLDAHLPSLTLLGLYELWKNKQR